MFKKVAIGLGLATLLVGLLFGRDAVSYVTTSWSRLNASVRDRVPVSFDLDRARNSIKNLDPEIRQNMKVIAQQEIEVSRLVKDIRARGEQIADARTKVEKLNGDLQSGTSMFVYKGETYSEQEVKRDLSLRFDRLQAMEQTQDKLQKILNAREQALSAAKEKLQAMAAAKRQLEIDVADLEARQKLVEVRQTNSEINIDDSQLARTRDMMDQIRTRIEVAEKLVNAEGQYQFEIPVGEEESDADITEKVTRYLKSGQKPSGLVNTK